MENRPNARPWQPKPFSIAVLDSDEYLADVLCDLLRESGFDAAAFYDISALMKTHRTTMFDAYVLDYLADWLPQSNALESLVTSIRGGVNSDVPIFVLGNQIAPEKIERLGNIIMQHKVRYLLRPLPATYLAKRVGEAVAKRAGI
jgi:DNA-binding response OmpR family regulator